MHYKGDNPDYPDDYYRLEIFFDFFNYAGIHRPVVLYTVHSDSYIEDVTVGTHYLNSERTMAQLSYEVSTAPSQPVQVSPTQSKQSTDAYEYLLPSIPICSVLFEL